MEGNGLGPTGRVHVGKHHHCAVQLRALLSYLLRRIYCLWLNFLYGSQVSPDTPFFFFFRTVHYRLLMSPEGTGESSVAHGK